MASGPITSRQIDGDKAETVTDFIFLGSKITADGDCSHEIKMLAAWKKSYHKTRQHVKKQRYHFADKSLYSPSYVFSNRPVWMWEVDHKEDWVLKKWCFWIRVSWTARRSNQSTLKEINPEYSLEGLMLKVKLQYFGLPDVNSQLTRKDLDAGKDRRQEEKGMAEAEPLAPLTQWTWVWANSRRW